MCCRYQKERKLSTEVTCSLATTRRELAYLKKYYEDDSSKDSLDISTFTVSSSEEAAGPSQEPQVGPGGAGHERGVLGEAPASLQSKSSFPDREPVHVKKERDSSSLAEQQVPAAAGVSPPRYSHIDDTSR